MIISRYFLKREDFDVKRSENDNKPGGVIAIDKPEGITSHDVVFKIRKLFGTARVGHTGTLDPMATGVLVVLIGRAAKACEFISKDSKRYIATLRLGYETDTEDITGSITSDLVMNDDDVYPTLDEVIAAANVFVGKIVQIPPMYSALKVDGRKLCDLAREGIEIERAGREIEVYSIDVKPTENKREFILDVHCSGGTYIRTLCSDIGKKLGTGGVMATLRRSEASGISLDKAYTLEALTEMGEDERWEKIMPTEELFTNYEKIKLPAFYERLFRSGCPIYLKKIGMTLPLGQRVRIADADGSFFALGEIVDAEEGIAVKSVKIFTL